MKDYLQLLIEKIELSLEPKDINTNTVKRMMFSKYGKDAFLDYEHLKYPVLNPETGEYDCKVIYNSYLMATKDGNNDIKEKTSVLLTKFGCKNKLETKLNEDEIHGLNELRIIIFPSNNDEENNDNCCNSLDDETIKDKTVCQCEACGYCCELSNTYTLCTEQLCPVCDSYMDTLTSEDDYDEFYDDKEDEEDDTDPALDLLRNMLDQSFSEIAYSKATINNRRFKYICNDCKTSNISITEDTKICPRCNSHKLIQITEQNNVNINETIRCSCINCDLTFDKKSITDNSCPICHKYII
jgi:hypothetical protein